MLPCPPFTHVIDIPEDGAPELTRLPAARGIYVFEDARGGTIAMAMTANLRRRVRARLERRGEVPVRRVLALRVGSDFEGDWAYLQVARRRLPETYRLLVERGQGWFLRCDPDARFPRFVRTRSPRGAARPGAIEFGPVPDKPTAQRAIDSLHETFDLCRYHDLLCETPNATACAYKEMGRCPAPCDGTISMDAYREMMREAIHFARDPGAARAAIEAEMRAASEALQFERAAALRGRLESTAVYGEPWARHLGDLGALRYLAAMPSERPDHVRLLLILGGWIEPWADVPVGITASALDEIADALEAHLESRPSVLAGEALDNLAVVCRYLDVRAGKTTAVFARLRAALNGAELAKMVRRAGSTGRVPRPDV